jgi:hypothetical protein
MHPRPPRRQRALALVRAQLARKGSPYFILFIVLAATGLAGFWSSVVLRWAGLNSMAVRYPLCVALAYLAFLFQLFLYVLFHRRRHPASATLDGTANVTQTIDVVDADVVEVTAAAEAVPDLAPAAAAGSSKEGGGWLDKLGGGGGGGDDAGAILVLLVIVVLVVVALAAGFVVLIEAPVLLAEVLVDGVLLAGMARRLRKVSPGDWVFSVIRRTCMPAIVVAIVFAVGGGVLQYLTPNATTMAEALSR